MASVRMGKREPIKGMPQGFTLLELLMVVSLVILLLAIVAAITLTMRKRPGLKLQNIAQQVAVKRDDRVRLVSMKSEKPE